VRRGVTVQHRPLIDLNLLPSQFRSHRYPAWYVLGLTLALVGCVLLVPAMAVLHSTNQTTNDFDAQLSGINEQLQGAQVDIGMQRGLSNEIARTQASIDAIKQERESLPGAGGPMSESLSLVTSVTPAGVSIDTISRSEKTVNVSGQADNVQSVISYVEAINDGGLFSNVVLWQVDTGSQPVKFTIQATR
jgi:Tfp pilus assembly protein PilN